MPFTPANQLQGNNATGFQSASDILIAKKQQAQKAQATETKPTLKEKLSGRLNTLTSEVTGKPVVDVMKSSTGGTDSLLAGAEALTRAAQAPIRAVGAVGGAVGDVIGAGLEATGITDAVGSAVKNINVPEPVKKAVATGVDTYHKLPQQTQEVASSIMDAANLPMGAAGNAVSKAVVDTAGNAVKQTAKATAKAVVPSAEKATANTYKGIMDVVENKKTLLKNFAKSEGSGKDPIKVIAENPDYMVKINQEAKTIDAAEAVTNMKRDIADYSEVRDAVLQTADEAHGLLPTRDVIKNVVDKFNTKDYTKYLDEGETAVQGVQDKLRKLAELHPEGITRLQLNEVRKAIDETVNTFTNTKLKDKVRIDLRTAFKETLENSVPETGLLKELNSKIGDLIDAATFSEKHLNGTKVKGGGLTDLVIKATGAAMGAGIGGAMAGIPGAVIGYGVSNLLSKTLIKNAINNPFDRAVLKKLTQTKPEIVQRAEDYISGAGKVAEDVTSTPQANPISPEVSKLKSYDESLPKTGAEVKKAGDGTEMFGAMGGVQTDENGDVSFNPAAAALGVAGMGAMKKVKGEKPVKAVRYSSADKVNGAKYEKAAENSNGYDLEEIKSVLDNKSYAKMEDMLKAYGVLLQNDAEKVKALEIIRDLIRKKY